LLCSIGLSVCPAPPPTPRFPPQFSSGLDLVYINHDKDTREVYTGRWFWDEAQNSDRYDFHHQHYRQVKINDYALETSFLYQSTDRAWNCSSDSISKHMPVHDFTNFKYKDDETIRGIATHVWENVLTSYTVKYYSRADNMDPVKIDIMQTKLKQQEILNFFEFDKGAQDPNIFNHTFAFPTVHCKAQELEVQVDRLKAMLPAAVCEKTVECARHYATCGCPYVWGGNSCSCGGKGGLDCSGIVHTCYVSAGYPGIARTAEAQSHQGSSCGSCHPSSTGSCTKGDLFFYDFEGKGVSHVVMYIGGGDVAECPHTGVNCRVLKPYTSHYVSCRRFC